MTRQQKKSDLQCDDVREGLSALLDGEVDASETAALYAHLEECVDCAVYENGMRALHERLCNELTDACDVDLIWERVEWAIAASDTQPAAKEPRSKRWTRVVPQRWAAAAMAAVAALLLVTVISTTSQLFQFEQKNQPVVTETVRDFETFRLRGGLLDVAAGEPNVVRGWMASKVDFKLPEDVTPPAGFKIAGGRLCSFLNRRLAFFHYEKGPDALSLYVMKASGLKLPGKGNFDTALSAKGLTTVTWAREGVAYVVVSGLPSAEVTEFASRLMGDGFVPGEKRL